MIRSSNTSQEHPTPAGIRRCAWRLRLLILARPRLISNLLALVALFSIGLV
ncbi:MAG: hypothetical protein ACRETZ_05300 [Steroidobacteraceae bacterium]